MAQCSIDIFAPSVSTVSKGIEGKLILLHSNERKLGKTAQAVRFPSRSIFVLSKVLTQFLVFPMRPLPSGLILRKSISS